MYQVNINASKVLGEVNPMLYGQMVEHAYWSVHLGVSSQLLDNGGFEFGQPDAFHSGHASGNVHPSVGDVAEGWQIFCNHPGNRYHSILDVENPYNAQSCQKLVVDEYVGGEVLLQQCFILCKKGVANEGFVFMRGDIGQVKVQLRDIDKRPLCEQVFEVNHEEWKEYRLNLMPEKDCRDGVFAIVVAGKGTLWVDQAQLYPKDDYQGHRTRADVVEHYKALRPTFLRWPGGTYLIWHHWKNAIGPLEERVYADGRRLQDTFGIGHYNEWDPNLFGTDEFIQLCRDCGAEPMINVTIKDTLQGALDWVEYVNGPADSKWGGKRAENGHIAPYGVKYWVVDNEPMIINEKKGYAKELYPILAQRFAEEMKKKDPSIEVYIMGNHNTQALMDRHPDYSGLVAQYAGGVMDKLCVHCYYDQSYYAPLQGMPYKLGETLTRIKGVLDEHSGGRDVKLFLSEFNPEGNTNIAGNMGQAIETAQIFHMLERKCAEGVVDAATMCQLCVNVEKYRGRWLRSAMVQLNREGSWVSPMYHVTRIYSELRQPKLVSVDSGIPETGTSAFNGYGIPAVDLVATMSESGKKLVLKSVNNTLERTFEAEISVAGTGRIRKITAHQVAAGDIYEMNTQFTPGQVNSESFSVEHDAKSFRFAFEPNAVTAFAIDLE